MPTLIEVTNTATVPISVTSHFHFFEVNPRLPSIARPPTVHLAVPAGHALQFEPGQTVGSLWRRSVANAWSWFAGLVDGPLEPPAKEQALAKARATELEASTYFGGAGMNAYDYAIIHGPSPGTESTRRHRPRR